MEVWKEVNKNDIPFEKYQVLVQSGEENGLNIKLESDNHIVNIFFGAGTSLRMLEEGIVPSNLFAGETFLRFKEENFKNVIYKIDNGQFGNFAKEVSPALYSILDKKHYIVINMNYIIEVITDWEPKFEIVKKNN